jgi:MFS family permease
VLLGGLLTDGPGWRWVLFVNPPLAVLILGATMFLLNGERRHAKLAKFDFFGAVLATGGMLLFVYAVVTAPSVGWGSIRTIADFAGALALLAAFVVNEHRVRNPLLPLSIFRIRGLAAANVTFLIALAGFISMFFLLTLYMQNVLAYSPLQAGVAYIPLCLGVIISAGVTSQLLARIGSRPIITLGCLVAAGGLYDLSRIPVHGSYASNLLPGMLVMSIGLGAVFVAVTSAANASVPADKAGLAAALLNTAQQVGGALGLAIFSAVAASRTSQMLAADVSTPAALTAGFQGALFASSIVLVAAAIIALRTSSTRGESVQPSAQVAAAGSAAA